MSSLLSTENAFTTSGASCDNLNSVSCLLIENGLFEIVDVDVENTLVDSEPLVVALAYDFVHNSA